MIGLPLSSWRLPKGSTKRNFQGGIQSSEVSSGRGGVSSGQGSVLDPNEIILDDFVSDPNEIELDLDAASNVIESDPNEIVLDDVVSDEPGCS